MVFNATFNNSSVISWRSVLLVEIGGHVWRKPPTCRKSLTNYITKANQVEVSYICLIIHPVLYLIERGALAIEGK
jgi:hypothetical protein